MRLQKKKKKEDGGSGAERAGVSVSTWLAVCRAGVMPISIDVERCLLSSAFDLLASLC